MTGVRLGPMPIAGLRGLAAYHVPKGTHPIDLPLHGNEGPAPPRELLQLLSDPETLRRYPSAARLEGILAARLGVAPARVLVTAGADEALDRAFRAYVSAGDEVVLPSPTFVMLPHYARLVGAEVWAPHWPAEAFPEDDVLAAIGERTRAVALVSPNNPTGAVIPLHVLATVARHAAEVAPEAIALVDFAYIECADEDPTADMLAHDNVLVFRTLSKVWGLAGLRVGYVVGPEALIAPLRAAGPPYSVSSPSLALAEAQLATGEARMQAYVARVKVERQALYDVLAAGGAEPVLSQANFVFARSRSGAAAIALRDGLAARGIGIRVFPGDPMLGTGARITCPGDEAQLARVLGALRDVLADSADSAASAATAGGAR